MGESKARLRMHKEAADETNGPAAFGLREHFRKVAGRLAVGIETRSPAFRFGFA